MSLCEGQGVSEDASEIGPPLSRQVRWSIKSAVNERLVGYNVCVGVWASGCVDVGACERVVVWMCGRGDVEMNGTAAPHSPAISPATIPSPVVRAWGEVEVLGRRRRRIERVSSSAKNQMRSIESDEYIVRSSRSSHLLPSRPFRLVGPRSSRRLDSFRLAPRSHA